MSMLSRCSKVLNRCGKVLHRCGKAGGKQELDRAELLTEEDLDKLAQT
jgi:hypothetical protein